MNLEAVSPGKTGCIAPFKVPLPAPVLLALVLFTGLDLAGQIAVPGVSEPTRFFTNVAAKLLSADLNLDAARIEIYPTNQYTRVAHRLFQEAANLYDSTTNRPETGYPYLPSVFRPLFRRDTYGEVFIAGYREVTNSILADSAGAPWMLDLDSAPDRLAIPAFGTPFDPEDTNEPMVIGIPLIVGAKKGFPNFNAFDMQNSVAIMRQLEFRRGRPIGYCPEGQVVITNQMYSIWISNTFGLGAWNSYSNRFPRPLRLSAQVNVFVSLTNELGGDRNVLFSNAPPFAATSVSSAYFTNVAIPAGGWPGWTNDGSFAAWRWPPSILVPLSNNSVVLPASSWTPNGVTQLVPLTGRFSTLSTLFPVPHWWLNLKERVQFFLVDTSVNPNRIVDYVNLSRTEDPVDISFMLQNRGGGCAGIPNDGSGNPWCTNRFGTTNGLDVHFPTVGIINQILRSKSPVPDVGDPNYVWDPGTGYTLHYSIDSFRSQFLPDEAMSSIFPEDQGLTFYKSNSFCTPLIPVTVIYTHVSWQANDPLVHYTIEDLNGVPFPWYTNVDYSSHSPPLNNLGMVNARYEPWSDGVAPLPPSVPRSSYTATDSAVKDPLVRRSDDWDFPNGQALSFATLGRVHRGTPWQTIYLKSEDSDLNTWAVWTADTNLTDAAISRPVNDRHLAHVLFSLLSTNDPWRLLSINSLDTNAWLEALNGLWVTTNSLPPVTTVMSSNSPQASAIVAGILNTRFAQPGESFRSLGDILATPQLSSMSPWITNTLWLPLLIAASDEAYEAIPSQLLAKLREDSVGSTAMDNGRIVIQFTGYDGYAYAILASEDLKHWRVVAIDSPANGLLTLTSAPASSQRFYRSVLLPMRGCRLSR